MEDRLKDALERLLEAARSTMIADGVCLRCGSCAHPDGTILHDEDCPIGFAEYTLNDCR